MNRREKGLFCPLGRDDGRWTYPVFLASLALYRRISRDQENRKFEDRKLYCNK